VHLFCVLITFSFWVHNIVTVSITCYQVPGCPKSIYNENPLIGSSKSYLLCGVLILIIVYSDVYSLLNQQQFSDCNNTTQHQFDNTHMWFIGEFRMMSPFEHKQREQFIQQWCRHEHYEDLLMHRCRTTQLLKQTAPLSTSRLKSNNRPSRI